MFFPSQPQGRRCGLRSFDPRSHACFSRAAAVAAPFRKDTLFSPAPFWNVRPSFCTSLPLSNGRPVIHFCGEKAAPAQATGRFHLHLCNTRCRDGTARRGSAESGPQAHGKHKYTRKKTSAFNPVLRHPRRQVISTTFVWSQRAHKKKADKEFSAHRSFLMIMKIQCRADNVLQTSKDLISESVSSGLLLYNESLIAYSHSDALSPRHHTFPFNSTLI